MEIFDLEGSGCFSVIAFAVALFSMAACAHCTDYSDQLAGHPDGLNSQNAINTTTRNAKWELEQEGYEVPADVLAGYEFEWCQTERCSRMVPGQTIYVRAGEGWYDRFKHELIHAVLEEVGYTGDHHAWMGSHGWCYGSPAQDCTDAWNPNRETGHPMSGPNPLEPDDE